MNSVTSALNMFHIVYAVKYGLRILMMNHIFPIKKVISSQIKMNILFKTKDVRKRKLCDRKIHKAMRIPIDIHETNKKFTVTVQPKNSCKSKFVDHCRS